MAQIGINEIETQNNGFEDLNVNSLTKIFGGNDKQNGLIDRSDEQAVVGIVNSTEFDPERIETIRGVGQEYLDDGEYLDLGNYFVNAADILSAGIASS